ncbi:unnamed protein product [Lasius platythorax]|uniref:Uncharacterized protein n=1 Tax=Lasius platythorax TaxID=488582 RepID=A0AAV2N1G4_9HYME
MNMSLAGVDEKKKLDIKTFLYNESFPSRRNDTTPPPLALLQLQPLFLFLSLSLSFSFSLSLYAVENLYSYQKVGVTRLRKTSFRYRRNRIESGRARARAATVIPFFSF